MTYEQKAQIIGALALFICGCGGLLVLSKVINAVKRWRGLE
jgi:hypothetical protein